MDKCILCGLDEKNPTFAKSFDYWTLLVNYMQPTLGSTLLVLNRHISNLRDLREEEVVEHLKVIKKLDTSLTSAFNPDMINELMLANVVRHVHYNIVPRYELTRDFGGVVWKDEYYGYSPVLSSELKSQNLLDEIKVKILENL